MLDTLDASDIFRVRYPDVKQYTFLRRNPLIKRRLDYFFVSNNIQEYVQCVKILPSYLSDHSPVFITVNFDCKIKRGKPGWKFNNSLLSDPDFKSKLQNHIKEIEIKLEPHSNPHIKWEFMKYEVRKFSISYSKSKYQLENSQRIYHENIVKRFSSTLDTPSESEFAESKDFLDQYFDNKTKGAILRSKSTVFEQHEKSSKYFLNLEKKRSENGTIKKLIRSDAEINDGDEILEELHNFYSNLFDRKITKTLEECKSFLSTLNLPKISNEHKEFCEKVVTLDELEACLFNMSIGKSPGNDGLTVEFYKAFWSDLKSTLFESIKFSRLKGELSTSQRQAIIKLIEKKDKDKRYIENWRPISLLNVDTKILSKCMARRLVPVLPTIISPDQTAYVKGRYIGESLRLTSDILDCTQKFNIPGYALTMDLQKAFDSIDHIFLFACLELFGFGQNFLCWAAILLNKNESCVTNSGRTTKYFSLSRGARQGDPIAAYFFILVLEVFFIMIRSNDKIKKLQILEYAFLLTAYADDTTFFVSDLESVNIIFATFDEFSLFSGMKVNQGKCELAGIGVKRSVLTALSGVKNVCLDRESIRILGVHFTYNSKLSLDKNIIVCIEKLHKIVRVWRMRCLSLLGKIIIFKSLALSKVIFIASMSCIPSDFLKTIENIHKDFIWDRKRPNIKHTTLVGDYSKGGLKDIDIPSKFKSLHLNWLRRLYDNNPHPWKLIALYYINSVCSDSILFVPNLCISNDLMNNVPEFYRNIIIHWMEVSQFQPVTSEMVLSESLFHNTCITINNSSISPSFCGIKNPSF